MDITEASRKIQERPTDLWPLPSNCVSHVTHQQIKKKKKRHKISTLYKKSVQNTDFNMAKLFYSYSSPWKNSAPQSRQGSQRRTDFPIIWNVNTIARMYLFYDYFRCKFGEKWLIQDMQSSPGSRAVTAKQKSIQQAYPWQQWKFSSICRCSGTRQLLVMPIWNTICRDGQLIPFGPHGTHKRFN